MTRPTSDPHPQALARPLDQALTESRAKALAAEQILVVIPTLNEARSIAACIASLRSAGRTERSQRRARCLDKMRIVVVDGGSTDGTQEIVTRMARADPNLVLLNNPDRLQSAGINLAVTRAATPEHVILLRCDAHAVYPPGYVWAVAEALVARPEAASVATVMDAAGRAVLPAPTPG